MRADHKVFPSSMAFAFMGNQTANAGNNITLKKKAAITPKAEKLPSSRNGGTSEVFMAKKPIAVVKLVRNTGDKLIFRASFKS